MRALVVAVAASLAATAASAENLTRETERMLRELKLGPEVMAGLDRELAVPQSWVDGAKKEGVIKIRLTMAEPAFDKVWRVFAARYPGIKYEYVRGTGRERAVVPLLAFKKGTIVSDVISSFDVLEHEYRAEKALVDMRELPSFANVPAEFSHPDAMTTSLHRQHYCMSYNTKLVKKEELPKTWEQLVDDPRFRNGKVGMAGNVHTWIPSLWGVKGDAWLDDFLGKLFNVLKPQIRKERLGGMPQLLSLGEYEIALPASDYVTRTAQDKGMFVSWHCPNVVPTPTNSVGIVAGTPRLDGARLFVNWLLSKEGQVTMFVLGDYLPSHKDLTGDTFKPYPDEVRGKSYAPLDAKAKAKRPELVAQWQKRWEAAGGVVAEGD
jgi:iron(III) transport system substrate-binding protein